MLSLSLSGSGSFPEALTRTYAGFSLEQGQTSRLACPADERMNEEMNE